MIQNRIPLTIALMAYDHVYEIRARDNDYEIRSGAVEIAGVDPTFVDLPSPHAFAAFADQEDWAVSDVPLAEYLQRRLAGDTTITALPIFTSRMFTHRCVFVRRDRIKEPADLRGARVGVGAQNLTECVYARGMLADMYGIGAADVTWVNEPERQLGALLAAGEVDAVIAPAHVLSLGTVAGSRNMGPLFEQPGVAERAYLAKTRVFPVVRALAVRTELLKQHRWLASNIYRAFEVARRRYFARLDDIRGSRVPIPAVDGHMRTVREAFGGDFWPYGIADNRATLETFVRYAAEQGLIEPADVKLEALFARIEPFVDKY